MNKKQVIQDLKKNKKPDTLYLLKKCNELKIKWQFFCKEGSSNYFRLSYKDQHIYVKNGSLFRSLDKISTLVVSNKDLVKQVLHDRKIKVPNGFVVQKLSEIKPLLKKHRLDFPLVLKPGFAACGKGVFPNLKNWAELKKAFNKARGIDHKYKDLSIIIEEYFPARDFRILVYKGKYLACAERAHPQIKGNGRSTIQQLIDKKSDKLKVDWQVIKKLKKLNLKLSDVLPKNKVIRLKETANICQGGMSINYTDKVCSKFKKIAETCAKEFNAQLLGVDLMTNDISNSKADYRIIELNDFPSILGMHDNPDMGKSEEVTVKLLKDIFNIK